MTVAGARSSTIKTHRMAALPNVHAAEAIPAAARLEIEELMMSGDLFRYTAAENAPVARLEKAFAAHLGVRFALAVSSCSAAMFLAMRALDLRPGARVIVPAFTFSAVPSAVVQAGCVPLLVEVGRNYRIDLDDFAAKLANADAVLISHMRGHTSNMTEIMRLADAAAVPVIEDAAHSLGTQWDGRKIGTIGRMGCFSFQSYKLLNAGEGGMLVSDDDNLMARAVIMSGAYEHNWKKHPVLQERFSDWQNRLPLYNMRMSNLSAVVLLPQIDRIEERVLNGRHNHDYVAARLNESPYFNVPSPLPLEARAPDSIQFNLLHFSDEEVFAFVGSLEEKGLNAQIFGLSKDNARAFWNWKFLGELPELPMTRAMLARACDVRLPARLSINECDTIAQTLLAAAEEVHGTVQSGRGQTSRKKCLS